MRSQKVKFRVGPKRELFKNLFIYLFIYLIFVFLERESTGGEEGQRDRERACSKLSAEHNVRLNPMTHDLR